VNALLTVILSNGSVARECFSQGFVQYVPHIHRVYWELLLEYMFQSYDLKNDTIIRQGHLHLLRRYSHSPLALPEELPAFLLAPDVVPFFVDPPVFPLGVDPDTTAAFFLGGIENRYGIREGPRGECIQPVNRMLPLYCNYDIIP
jgi:hypothetical protein